MEISLTLVVRSCIISNGMPHGKGLSIAMQSPTPASLKNEEVPECTQLS